MRIGKSTPDGFFHIIIESEMWEESGEFVPTESIEQLVLELEMLTAELKHLVEESEKGSALPN